MATKDTGDEEKRPERQAVNLQLVPSGGSDQPVFSNMTVVQPAPGVALVDFGFLDPGALRAVASMAQAGKKVPERVQGRLAVRIALSYDALAALHRQIGSVLQRAGGQKQKPQ
jgi:hypothetical protein